MNAALFLLFLAAQQTTADRTSHCGTPPEADAPAPATRLMEGVGTVHFPITTSNPEAQKFFDQGLAQMHSFWTREAERSFVRAAELDPEAPMPHFGIAMVAAGLYQPYFQIENWDSINGKQDRTNKRAEAAARKALELAAKPGKATPLEKLYIEAVAARRIPSGKDSDEEYIAAWRRLLAAYPKEVEARTYLSLHLMRGFDLPAKTPRKYSLEAVEILRQLLKDAPEHPGVHHYVIHGFEGSPYAKEAWASSEKYFTQAPEIPHALHMPGHIYSQTGRWRDAQIAFDAAKKKELEYIKADPSYGNGHHGHNVHYLSTVYSFDGQYEKAVAEAQHLLGFAETENQKKSDDLFTSAYAQGFFAMQRALTQHEKWDEILEGKMLPEINRPRQQAWLSWARGIAYAAKGDAGAAKEQARRMDQALAQYARKMKGTKPPELVVAREELAAQIALASGSIDKGLRALERVAAKEHALRYTEPPYYARPVHEALGKWALKHNRLDTAERAFRGALEHFEADRIAEAGLREVAARRGGPSGN
jgi:hypothetical protein